MGNVGNDFFKTKRLGLGLAHSDQSPLQSAPAMLGNNTCARQESKSFVALRLADSQTRIADRLLAAPYDPPKRVFEAWPVVGGKALLVKRQHRQRHGLALNAVVHFVGR